MNEIISGIVLVNKPSGVLSSVVVSQIKRKYKLNKVGHGGTLDKFASGLLLILINKGTKLFDYIKSLPKSYEGVIKLGEVRTTDDIYGRVLFKVDLPIISIEDVKRIFEEIKGEQLQIPPAFANVHIKGLRAREIAKKDYYQALNSLKPRKIYIYDIRLLEFRENEIEFFAECSGGTYIRSIARDLGKLLGVGGYLKELRRIKIGPWHVKDALRFEDLKRQFINIQNYLIPLETIKG